MYVVRNKLTNFQINSFFKYNLPRTSSLYWTDYRLGLERKVNHWITADCQSHRVINSSRIWWHELLNAFCMQRRTLPFVLSTSVYLKFNYFQMSPHMRKQTAAELFPTRCSDAFNGFCSWRHTSIETIHRRLWIGDSSNSNVISIRNLFPYNPCGLML